MASSSKEEISKLLQGLDPLQISNLYDTATEALKGAPEELLSASIKPAPDHKKESAFLTDKQLQNITSALSSDSFLTPEQRNLLMPDIDTLEPKGDATLSVTASKEQMEIKDEQEATMMELPHFTSGLSHAQTMALAEEVKENLIHKKKEDHTLYEQFDDTLTRLFEEIKNNDVLSDGQKSALLMKVNMLSSTILKESFEVNV